MAMDLRRVVTRSLFVLKPRCRVIAELPPVLEMTRIELIARHPKFQPVRCSSLHSAFKLTQFHITQRALTISAPEDAQGRKGQYSCEI